MSSSNSNPMPPKASLLGLPSELLTMIVENLEPQLEEHLHSSFRGAVSMDEHHLAGVAPDKINGDTEPAAWDAYRDLQNLQLTCKHLNSHANMFKTVLIYSPIQLIHLFKALLQNPGRMQQVRHLQLHHYCLLPNVRNERQDLRVDGCGIDLFIIKEQTGWDIRHIASEIYRKAGYGSAAPNAISPTIVMAMALVHLLPNVKSLYLPYPRTQFEQKL